MKKGTIYSNFRSVSLTYCSNPKFLFATNNSDCKNPNYFLSINVINELLTNSIFPLFFKRE